MAFLTAALESRRDSQGLREFLRRRVNEAVGFAMFMASLLLLLILATYDHTDPSFNVATGKTIANVGGPSGAVLADMLLQFFGVGSILLPISLAVWSMRFMQQQPPRSFLLRIGLLPPALILVSLALSVIPSHNRMGIHAGFGGAIGSIFFDSGADYSFVAHHPYMLSLAPLGGMIAAALAGLLFLFILGLSLGDWRRTGRFAGRTAGLGLHRGMGMGAGLMAQAVRAGSNAFSGRQGAGSNWRSLLARLDQSGAPSSGPMRGSNQAASRDDAQGPSAVRRPSPPVPPAESAPVARPAAQPESARSLPLPSFFRPLDEARANRKSLGAAYRTLVTMMRPAAGRDSGARRDPSFDGGFDGRVPGRLDSMAALGDPAAVAGDTMAPQMPGAGALDSPLPEANGPRRLPASVVAPKTGAPAPGKKAAELRQPKLAFDLEGEDGLYALPSLTLLATPTANRTVGPSEEALQQNALLLLGVLEDFGVHGDIVKVRPGPVVTLYELEPAPGTKSSRVIGLADDIARSMSAISVRVAVVPGRNVIGIELPNLQSDTVFLRELLASEAYERSSSPLPLVLGKDIGGAPIMADLTKMPHLLIAGTTGSGKSVGINTMILSILYRLPPDRCKFIMIDPKMLELSIYDGIPHLLAPVVTDPKKAVVALKWTVREMETRYRAMSKLGVRNIDGFNARLADAAARGETLTRRVQTGFDAETGEPEFEEQVLGSEPLPYIVVVVDEMADLMLVAGKEIEAAVQRLAQMARAAGIHIIMATQRPSVDVITGTIKANFPTRISFQVTSKIDSRTILGESGAEQLLGRGDMLYMSGGGRITRVHGPFVSDMEVESIVNHLKAQGRPCYIDDVTEEEQTETWSAEDAESSDGGNELYDKAVALVTRERKASTSFVQRHLQIGYNRAARLIEQMEKEGVVSSANHVGKREVLAPPPR